VDERGLVIRIDGFVDDDLAAAYAALDARYAELEPALPRPNRAWDVVRTHGDAFARRDPDGWRACLHPELVYDDRRSRGVAGVFVAADAIASLHTIFDMDEATIECRLVATVGDRVVLYESYLRGSDGAVGEIEVSALDIVEIGEDGRITHLIAFDPDSLDRALAELNARAAAVEPRLNRAARVVADQDDAFARRDWEGIAGTLASNFVVDDRRPRVACTFTEAESVATLRYGFELAALHWDRRIFATRGERLVLVKDIVTGGADLVDYEMQTLTLVELDRDGRIARHTIFDPDDFEVAVAELDARGGPRR
jgi:hypothetical protein